MPQENGVAVAVESIYRDLEYARSLIKRHTAEEHEDSKEDEGSTVRVHDNISPGSLSSSAGSGRGVASEDWSVISEQDERRSSLGSHHSGSRSAKRTSFAAAVLSVLPDAFVLGSPQRS